MNLLAFLGVTGGAYFWLGWRGAVVAFAAAFAEWATARRDYA